MGLNRFRDSHFGSRSADKNPSLPLAPFGQWVNRNETWAEQQAGGSH